MKEEKKREETLELLILLLSKGNVQPAEEHAREGVRIAAQRDEIDEERAEAKTDAASHLFHALRHYYESGKDYLKSAWNGIERKKSDAAQYMAALASYAATIADIPNIPVPQFSFFKTDYNGLLGYAIPTLANTGFVHINHIAQGFYKFLMHVSTHELLHILHPTAEHSWVYQMADYVAPQG